MFKLELIIYLLFIIILTAYKRVNGAMHRAVFYAKNREDQPESLKTYIKNIHFLATPEWYANFGALFFALMIIARIVNPVGGMLHWFLEAFLCLCATMFTSGMVSHIYQGYINIGSGLPFVDENEKKFFEVFAIKIRGKKYTYEMNRFWVGKNRPKVALASLIGLIITLILIVLV